MLPISAPVGAVFLLWADVAARTLTAPAVMPVGVVTGANGEIFYVWLLRRRGV